MTSEDERLADAIVSRILWQIVVPLIVGALIGLAISRVLS